MSDETQDPGILEAMELLKPLAGRFEGGGRGGFPTIDDFRYTEELTFTGNGIEALLHYEQKTWTASDGDKDGEPLHWESGFLRPVAKDRAEMLNSQNSGRVEVLAGPLEVADGVVTLRLDSLLLGHDERMLQSRRVYVLQGDQLTYTVEMATTGHGQLAGHLEARLTRVLE